MLDRHHNGPPELSVVIPMHNSASVLARTIERWTNRLTNGHNEVVLVENGSTDVTWLLAQQLAIDSGHVKFVLRQSDKGMGNALRTGISASSGRNILLSADDLPFDFDDLDRAAEFVRLPPVVIGSKAHPASEVSRDFKRSLFTLVYKNLRSSVLKSTVGDSQGTILAEGDWLRAIAPQLDEPGFLFSTQLIYAAELQGLQVAEVPVKLSVDHAPKKSTVRWSDAFDMGAGLIRLRRKRADLSAISEYVIA